MSTRLSKKPCNGENQCAASSSITRSPISGLHRTPLELPSPNTYIKAITDGLTPDSKRQKLDAVTQAMKTAEQGSPTQSDPHDKQVVLNQKKIPISEWKAHGATQATDSEILLYALLISTVLGERMAQKEFINECDYIADSIGLASAATGNTYTGRIINQSMAVYSDSNLGAVANAMVVFSGPGQLEEPLTVPQLKKYLLRHCNKQELGPPLSKGGKQKRVISALAAVVDLLRKEGPQLLRLLLEKELPAPRSREEIEAELSFMSERFSQMEQVSTSQIQCLTRNIEILKCKLKKTRSQSLGALNEKVDKKTVTLRKIVSSSEAKIALLSKQKQAVEEELERSHRAVDWYKARYYGSRSDSMAHVDLGLMKLETAELKKRINEILKENHEKGVKVLELTAALQSVSNMKELGFGRIRGNRAPEGGFSEVFEEHALSMLATGASTPVIMKLLNIFLQWTMPEVPNEEKVVPGASWFDQRRVKLDFFSQALGAVILGGSASYKQVGWDETKVDGISTCNVWTLVSHPVFGAVTVNIGVANILVGGTAEETLEHIVTVFERSSHIFLKIRDKLSELGHNPDDFAPIVVGGVGLHKVEGSMHDTCATANLTEQVFCESVGTAGLIYYGKEEWEKKMDGEPRFVIDGRCTNHERQLPPAQFFREYSKLIKDELSDDIKEAKKTNPTLRLHTDIKDFVYALQKLIHRGYDCYAKGEGQAYLAHCERNHTEEAKLRIKGRQVGDRFEGVLKVCHTAVLELDRIINYGNERRKDSKNDLVDSVQVMARCLQMQAGVHALAIAFHVCWEDWAYLVNSDDIDYDPISVNVTYEQVVDFALVLQKRDCLDIIGPCYRVFHPIPEYEAWREKRDNRLVPSYGSITRNRKVREQISNVIFGHAERPDAEEFTPLLIRALNIYGESIIISFRRSAFKRLNRRPGVIEEDGEYSSNKATPAQKKRAKGMKVNNDNAEQPFAVVKSNKRQKPSMTLRNAAALASAKVNHTFTVPSPPAKTEKTRNKTKKVDKHNGQNFHTTPEHLKKAIFALFKDMEDQRNKDYKGDCVKQKEREEQRVNDQRDERRVTAANKAETQNYMMEVALIQSGTDLEAQLESKKCDGDREKLLKDQIHARCSKGRGFEYPDLSTEYQNTRGKDPKITFGSGGVKVRVEYLTRLVKELIRIDLKNGRYESDVMDMELEIKLYRDIPSVGTTCALGKELDEQIAEEEGDELGKSVHDDPELLSLERLFKDKKFIDEDLPDSTAFLCLGIQFNPDYDHWVAECVQLDKEGEVPRTSKTRNGIIKDQAKIDYSLSVADQHAMTEGIAAYEAIYGSSSSS